MKIFILVFSSLLLFSCSKSFLDFEWSVKDERKKPAPMRITHPEIDGMKFIQGGYFMMGSNLKPNEKPVRKIFIESLYMDRMEVTVDEFQQFAKATGRKMPKQPSWNNWNHPVINVSWNDANAYAKWVGKRLPTEAEWEYVARGGAENFTYVYENSQQYGKNYENIADESMRRVKFHFPVVSGYDDGYVYTSPVGIFAPNKFGVHDLNGNVLEWCSDWYDEKNNVNQSRNPTGPAKGNYKVIRGASWNRSGEYMRATHRTFYTKSVRFEFLGFRCVKDAEMPITQK